MEWLTNPESVVIGASLISESHLLDALETIKPHHFTDPRNQRIWEWMSNRSQVGAPVDIGLALDEFGASESVRLSGYMDAATGLGVTLAGAAEGLVKAYYRKALLEGLQAAHLAAKGPTPHDAVPLLEATLTALSDGASESTVSILADVLDDSMSFLLERQEAKESGASVYVPTGIGPFDFRLDGGGAPGELIVIAARPGMGKTELLIGGSVHQGLHIGTTAIFSLEMSKAQLGLRTIRNLSQVDIRKHTYTPDEWDRMDDSIRDAYQANLWIDDTPGLSVSQLRRRSLRVRRKRGPLAAVWIDYLQLMTGPGQNRETVVSGISRDLKALAKELECPVFLLAQLNRGCEARQDKRPLLSDLRESGAVEQDADAVCMLYRDAYYNPDTTATPHEIEFIFRKFRRGQPGKSIGGWNHGMIYDTPEGARDA